MASRPAARLRKAEKGGKLLEKERVAGWWEVLAETWCGHHIEAQSGTVLW